MNTAILILFAVVGAVALVVVVAAVRRGWRRGRRINRILSMDASARDVRRAEREARSQKEAK